MCRLQRPSIVLNRIAHALDLVSIWSTNPVSCLRFLGTMLNNPHRHGATQPFKTAKKKVGSCSVEFGEGLLGGSDIVDEELPGQGRGSLS